MPSATTLLLPFALALTACAGTAQQAAAPRTVSAALGVQPTRAKSVTSRIGPPSPRGLSFRRIDPPREASPPIAQFVSP